MKRLLLIGFAALTLMGCDVYVIEPRYDARDKVIGAYDMEEYSETYHDYVYYDVSISKGSRNSDVIYIHNFYGANITVMAYVNYNHIDIPDQLVDGYDISGSGTVYGDYLSLSYSVRDRYAGTITDYCSSEAYFSY